MMLGKVKRRVEIMVQMVHRMVEICRVTPRVWMQIKCSESGRS